MLLAPPLLVFVRIFRPVIIGLTAVATGVLRVLRIKPVSEIGDVIDRDSVAALIGESSEEGLLKANQHDLLSGALAFEDTKAEVVGLPLAALVTVEPDVTPAGVEQLVTATGYSRSELMITLDRSGPHRLHPPGRRLETDPASRYRPMDRRCIRPLGHIRTTATLQTALATLRRSAHTSLAQSTRTAKHAAVALEHPRTTRGRSRRRYPPTRCHLNTTTPSARPCCEDHAGIGLAYRSSRIRVDWQVAASGQPPR
jgi:hypothetical protein